jgi:lysozyme
VKTNAAGRRIIVEREGIHETSYPDPASLLARALRKPAEKRPPNWLCLPGDPWTIGIGATGPGIGPGITWTKEQIWARFERDLEMVELQVERAVCVPVNEDQFSALVSFTFNVGIHKLTHGGPGGRPSRLLARLNDGDYLGAAAEFPKWVHAGDQVEPGLVARRAREQALFLAAVG